MNWKRKLLEKSRLYLIIDNVVCRNKVVSIAARIKETGIDIVQYRDKISSKEAVLKNAQRLKKLLFNSGISFIINDFVDIAKITDCDGVHLGQDDIPIKIARQLLGPDKIIGISCHNLRQALAAQGEGADYISVGPVFSTATKPEYRPLGLGLIKGISKKIKIPLFAIGGISENNIDSVLSSGAKRVAICRAICQSRNIVFTVDRITNYLKR